MAEEQIQRIELPLSGGRVLVVQVSLASIPIVPAPPHPRRGEIAFHFRADEKQVASILALVEELPEIPIVPQPGQPGTTHP